MNQSLMKCGHVAQGHKSDGSPVCVICVGLVDGADIVELDTENLLEGRFAKCAYNHADPDDSIRPSSFDLAFFEYRGPGSPYAREKCTCWYNIIAHTKSDKSDRVCNNFTPVGPAEFDVYYDGCKGWD